MYKQTLISNLRKFARQRPGLEFGNYGDAKSYRAEMRAITRDLAHAETLLRAVQYDDSISVQDIIDASRSAFSGRLEIEACMHGQSGATTCGKCGHVWCDRCDPAPSAMCHKCNGRGPSRHKPNGLRIDYCTGQYFPTEYRKAVCAVLASALWGNRCRTAYEVLGPAAHETINGQSPGDRIRAHFQREFGRGIASRYFN
jgi:hypothetical protein